MDLKNQVGSTPTAMGRNTYDSSEDRLFFKAVRCVNLITWWGREKRENDKQSDKLSYSTCKDPHICNNETFTAAASRAESRIILQCIQDKAHYILYSSLDRWNHNF